MTTRFKLLLVLLGAVLCLPALSRAHMPSDSATAPAAVPGPDSEPRFQRRYVDLDYGGDGKPGWVRAGDIDLDGDRDLVAGGGYALFVYENGGQADGWQRHGSLDDTQEIGANGGELFDVDGDDDLDVVSALYEGDLGWWENPGAPLTTKTWAFHVLSTENRYLHDLIRVDREGVLDVLAALYNSSLVWWRNPGSGSVTGTWVRYTIDGDDEGELVALYVVGGVYWYDVPADPLVGAWPRTRILASVSDPFVGLALGDLDADLDLDVAVSNKWFEQPASPTTADWTGRQLFADAVQNVVCFDVNRDGRLDVVRAEGFVYPDGQVLWVEAPVNPKTQSWTEHVAAEGLDGPENLWVGDLNGDGLTDFVSGEMGTSTGFDDSDSNLFALFGRHSDGTLWERRDLSWSVESAREPAQYPNDPEWEPPRSTDRLEAVPVSKPVLPDGQGSGRLEIRYLLPS